MIYVEQLIGPETVNTMPRETIEALEDPGQITSTLEQAVDDARRTLENFDNAGVDYQEVVDALEREGVQKFADSFKELFEGVCPRRGRVEVGRGIELRFAAPPRRLVAVA